MGNWRVKEPYIAKVKEAIENLIHTEGLDGKVKYAWVKGHQANSMTNPDIYWNNYVDLLAKGEQS
jgi:ribonuclease HI